MMIVCMNLQYLFRRLKKDIILTGSFTLINFKVTSSNDNMWLICRMHWLELKSSLLHYINTLIPIRYLLSDRCDQLLIVFHGELNFSKNCMQLEKPLTDSKLQKKFTLPISNHPPPKPHTHTSLRWQPNQVTIVIISIFT